MAQKLIAQFSLCTARKEVMLGEVLKTDKTKYYFFCSDAMAPEYKDLTFHLDLLSEDGTTNLTKFLLFGQDKSFSFGKSLCFQFAANSFYDKTKTNYLFCFYILKNNVKQYVCVSPPVQARAKPQNKGKLRMPFLLNAYMNEASSPSDLSHTPQVSSTTVKEHTSSIDEIVSSFLQDYLDDAMLFPQSDTLVQESAALIPKLVYEEAQAPNNEFYSMGFLRLSDNDECEMHFDERQQQAFGNFDAALLLSESLVDEEEMRPL